MTGKKGFVYSSDGVKLYYETFGKGSDPLFLLSGGPGLSHAELNSLRPLSTDNMLIYYDQRGTGRSTKVKANNYTIEASVQDLESIRSKLDLQSVSLLGFAWGATIAVKYALAFPRNVRRLILVSLFSSAEDINSVFENIRARATLEQEEVLRKYEAAGLYKNGKYPEEYLNAVQPLYAPFTSASSSVSSLLTKVFADLSWDVYRALWGEESEFRITGNMKGYDLRRNLRELGVPTMIIQGDSDFVPIEFARRDAEQIEGSRLEIIEDAKHYCFLDQPEKFQKIVRGFVKENH